jgi:hypothetical protein
VGARKKARQWTESDETGAEKIGRTVKTKKNTRNKQREAIQENTKANTGKPNKNKIQMKSKTK